MKKIFSLALAAVMTASLATVAFASTSLADKSLMIGYNSTGASRNIAFRTDTTSDGSFDLSRNEDTFDSTEYRGGTKVALPLWVWKDAVADGGNNDGNVDANELKRPTADDVKGFKVYTNWKVGKLDTAPKIEYVKIYDGTKPSYQYCVVVELPKNTTTKSIDIAGTITVAKSSSAGKVTTDLNTFNFDTSYGRYDEDVVSGSYGNFTGTFSGTDKGAVVDFDDNAEDIDIDFQGLMLFTVNVNGQGNLNLRYNTKYNSEIGSLFPAANLDFMTFEASPAFNRNGTAYLYGDSDKFFYEVTKDGIRDLRGDYNEEYEAYEFKTRRLTSYVISDVELDTDTTITSSSSTPASSSSNAGSTGKPNPDTGR